MATMTSSSTLTRPSGRRRTGLVLAGLLSLGNIAGVLVPAPEGEVGPPLVVLAIGATLGVIGLVAVVITWRSGNRAALRVAAGCLIVSALTAVPGFFVDVPAPIKVWVSAIVLFTIAAVVLMFSSERRPTSVTD